MTAAAAETERLLGLQAERAPAEDPRVLEAAAYMKSAPALEHLTLRDVARAVPLSPSRLPPLNIPQSLSGEPEAGAGLLPAGYGTISHTGLHGCGLCHPVPYGGYQPQAVWHVHD